MILEYKDKNNYKHTLVINNENLNQVLRDARDEGADEVKDTETGRVYIMRRPNQEEIKEYMELHNGDEVGLNDKWSLEDAEHYLLLSDKYYYLSLPDFTPIKD